MISIRNTADLARAFDGPMEPHLRALLTLRRDQLLDGTEVDLSELVHIIVVQHSDRLADVEAEAGFPLTGDDAALEWVERHPGGWVEGAIITDDDGHAVSIFVPDCIRTDPALLLALLAHA